MVVKSVRKLRNSGLIALEKILTHLLSVCILAVVVHHKELAAIANSYILV